MEKLVIQASTDHLARVEDFIRSICDDNYISNYYATISVPVMKAAELASHGESDSQITIIFDHCHGGVQFTIQTDSPCFSQHPISDVPPLGSDEESLYLAKILTDQLSVLDDGRVLQMTFCVMGIDFHEASYRVQVLKKFYAEQRNRIVELVEG